MSENRPRSKKEIVWTVSRVDYSKYSKSVKPKTHCEKVVGHEYGLNTVEQTRNKSFEPSPLARNHRFSPYTVPKHDNSTISKYDRSDSHDKKVRSHSKLHLDENYISVKSNESTKVKPIELRHDEESSVTVKELTSFNSPLTESLKFKYGNNEKSSKRAVVKSEIF